MYERRTEQHFAQLMAYVFCSARIILRGVRNARAKTAQQSANIVRSVFFSHILLPAKWEWGGGDITDLVKFDSKMGRQTRNAYDGLRVETRSCTRPTRETRILFVARTSDKFIAVYPISAPTLPIKCCVYHNNCR